MPARGDHPGEVAYFFFELFTLGSKHCELRSCTFEPFSKLVFELRERVSHNVLVEHFALESFKHFPFEVVLSDVLVAGFAEATEVFHFFLTVVRKGNFENLELPRTNVSAQWPLPKAEPNRLN